MNKKGVSLIEVLVAMAVFTAAAASVLALQSTGLKTNSQARVSRSATDLSKTLIEQFRGSTSAFFNQTTGTGYSCSAAKSANVTNSGFTVDCTYDVCTAVTDTNPCASNAAGSSVKAYRVRLKILKDGKLKQNIETVIAK